MRYGIAALFVLAAGAPGASAEQGTAIRLFDRHGDRRYISRSSGIAILDNTTCRSRVERGRFVFAQTPAYEGIRYATQRLRWDR